MIKVFITKNKFNIQPKTYLQRGKFPVFPESEKQAGWEPGKIQETQRVKPANRKLGEERREQGKHRNQSGTSNLEFGIPTEVAVWMNRSSKCMRNGEQVSRRLGQRPTNLPPGRRDLPGP